MARGKGELPQYRSNVATQMPEGNDAVASRVQQFGTLVQSFTNLGASFTSEQLGVKEKATEMVLKTNIDNSMREFARSSINMFDPKKGIANYDEQSSKYVKGLLEKSEYNLHGDTVRAYAEHAKSINQIPLQNQLVKQAHNEAKVSLLESIDSNVKDSIQSINLIPLADIQRHHKGDPDVASIQSANYLLSQALNQIDVAAQTGILTPEQANILKKQSVDKVQMSMMSHTFKVSQEIDGAGAFVRDLASQAERGQLDTVKYGKYVAEFKNIEERYLAENSIALQDAKENITKNLKNISLGKDSNAFVDSYAQHAPLTFAGYKDKKEVNEQSGNFYKSLTASSEAQALRDIQTIQDHINNSTINEESKVKLQRALDLSVQNSTNYFKRARTDPMSVINEKNILGDISTQDQINKALNTFNLPESLRPTFLGYLSSVDAEQNRMKIPQSQHNYYTNADARNLGKKLLAADADSAFNMLADIREQFGNRSVNVMRQLIDTGSVPKSYINLLTANPSSNMLRPFMYVLKNNIDVKNEQFSSDIKKQVVNATTGNIDINQGNPSYIRRFLGSAYQGTRVGFGLPIQPAATNTGILGTGQIIDAAHSQSLTKLAALVQSIRSIDAMPNDKTIKDLESNIEKLSNHLVNQGMVVDDAIAQSVNLFAGQYDFINYKNNIIRFPRHLVDLNVANYILMDTPQFLNKITWRSPRVNIEGMPASRADDIKYFKNIVAKGHWATDPTDQSMVWVGGNGVVPVMENGNPLSLTFESLSNIETTIDPLDNPYWIEQIMELFQKNGTAFNHKDFTGPIKGMIPEKYQNKFNAIENTFGITEMANTASASRSKKLHDLLFKNLHAQDKKLAKEFTRAANVKK